MGANSLDLNQRMSGQAGCGNDGAGGQVVDCTCDTGIGEEGLVNLVHRASVIQVLQEHGYLDDVVEGNVDACQNGLDVLQCLGGLLLNATGNQTAGHGIDTGLSGDVVVVGERNGLGGQSALGSIRGCVGQLDQVASLGLVGLGALTVGDQSLDCDSSAHGQGCHAGNGLCGYVGGEETGDYFVDGIHVFDVSQEYGQTNDIGHHMIDAFDNSLDVAHCLSGLLLDAAFNHCAGCRVDTQLSGKVVVVRECYGLRAHGALGCILGIPCHYHVIGHDNYLPLIRG